MGYCMSMVKCRIFIKSEMKERALEKLKNIATEKMRMGGSWTWVNMNYDIIQAETLENALDNIGWDTETDDFGNIVRLDFCREKLGDETKIFGIIAEFFIDGSFIEMVGEDGDRWRWVMKDGKCKYVNAKITWGDNDE